MIELDGQKVLEKVPNETLFKRMRIFMGPTDWSNYTVEADVRINEKRRQMGDAGIIAQRYTLVAFGNNQRLEMNSWQPEVARAACRAVRLEARHLVSPQAARGKYRRRQDAHSRQSLARRPKPSRPSWLIDRMDPIPNQQGSPGLFADAQFGVYFDNLKVTANQ